MGISVKLRLCKLGWNLVDLLVLHFLWVSDSLKVVLCFIAPHLFAVTIAVQNSTQFVIVIMMDNFTFVFNIVEDFVDCCANLVSQSAIVIWLKQIITIGIGFCFSQAMVESTN